MHFQELFRSTILHFLVFLGFDVNYFDPISTMTCLPITDSSFIRNWSTWQVICSALCQTIMFRYITFGFAANAAKENCEDFTNFYASLGNVVMLLMKKVPHLLHYQSITKGKHLVSLNLTMFLTESLPYALCSGWWARFSMWATWCKNLNHFAYLLP